MLRQSGKSIVKPGAWVDFFEKNFREGEPAEIRIARRSDPRPFAEAPAQYHEADGTPRHPIGTHAFHGRRESFQCDCGFYRSPSSQSQPDRLSKVIPNAFRYQTYGYPPIVQRGQLADHCPFRTHADELEHYESRIIGNFIQRRRNTATSDIADADSRIGNKPDKRNALHFDRIKRTVPSSAGFIWIR
jgi:hypothetical protein